MSGQREYDDIFMFIHKDYIDETSKTFLTIKKNIINKKYAKLLICKRELLQ